jgi:putative membrane protein
MTGERHWFGGDGRVRIERAVQELEARTAAELVVTVRRASGQYRDADLAFASLCAFVALVFYVYYPTEFPDDPVPPAIFVLYLASALFCSQVAWLRRVFVRKVRLRQETERAARAEFLTQGISATRTRCGILVYVSLFERHVEVVCDVGISGAVLSAPCEEALTRVRLCLREGGVGALTSALGVLGVALSQTLPRAADDVNELADGVMA